MAGRSDQIFEAHSGFNSLEATYHNGTLNVSVDNPWAGSTETGFGATCYVDLSKDDMIKFGKWLLAMAER